MRASLSGADVALLGVSDGMGGKDHGDIAAAAVIRSLSGFLCYLPSSLQQSADTETIDRLVTRAIHLSYRDASDRLNAVAAAHKSRDIGTTLLASVILQKRLAVWWLGDSRAYLFADGRLTRLTSDHSKVEETLQLSEEEALEHPERNQVSRFLCPGNRWLPEIRFFDINEGDVVLLVSDGVSGACRSWELESYLAYWLAAQVPPDVLARQILRFIARNVHDNASIALAVCGVPKPFGPETATVELPIFVRRFLRPELTKLLAERPATTQEWLARTPPPWRNESSGVPNGRIVGDDPLPLAAPDAAVCLLCGTQLLPGAACPEHGRDHLWQGSYLEIVSPTGQVRFAPLPPLRATTIGQANGSADVVALAGDFLVSALQTQVTDDGEAYTVEDLDSDNGTWLRVRKVSLPHDPWLHEGISLKIGRHQIAIRSTQVSRLAPSETASVSELLNHHTDLPAASVPLAGVTTEEATFDRPATEEDLCP